MQLDSPMMLFSLQLLTHGIEHYIKHFDDNENQFDFKLSILHISHAVELAIKATLVNRNIDVFKANGTSLNIHECISKINEVLSPQQPLAFSARVKLLFTDRNAMQHKYGDIDVKTMGYHMDTAYYYIKEIFNREFGLFEEALIEYTMYTKWSVLEKFQLFIGGYCYRYKIVKYSNWDDSDLLQNIKLCKLVLYGIEEEGELHNYKIPWDINSDSLLTKISEVFQSEGIELTSGNLHKLLSCALSYGAANFDDVIFDDFPSEFEDLLMELEHVRINLSVKFNDLFPYIHSQRSCAYIYDEWNLKGGSMFNYAEEWPEFDSDKLW